MQLVIQSDLSDLLTSEIIYFKSKSINQGRAGHLIMIKHSALNNRVPNYMKKKLTDLKGEMDSFTIIVEDYSTTPSMMDKITID